jgi:hypothetical protein
MDKKHQPHIEDDDDCPPPLEDMSDHLLALKSIKENQTNQVTKDDKKAN